LALLYGKNGQIYDGMQELERAIDLHPRQYPALKNLAVLYEKAGFKNKAVEMWERSLSVAPDDATRTSLKDHLRKLI
jgi:Tfp pilus assembly protein PilF